MGGKWGWNWKRVLLELLGAVVIWLTSVIMQAVVEAPKYVSLFVQSNCSATGYPVPVCIEGFGEWLSYVLNILFWFLLIHIVFGFFAKGSFGNGKSSK